MEDSAPLWATFDRVEEDERGEKIAVLLLDDGQELHLPARLLPAAASPQDVLAVTLSMAPQETKRRADEVQRRQQELFGE